MIQRFRFGNPIETNAVVEDLSIEEGTLPFFDLIYEGEEDTPISSMDFIYTLHEKDIVYGLGEQVRGINKRGWVYTSCNSDNPHHQEDTKSLYGTHNFLIVCYHLR